MDETWPRSARGGLAACALLNCLLAACGGTVDTTISGSVVGQAAAPSAAAADAGTAAGAANAAADAASAAAGTPTGSAAGTPAGPAAGTPTGTAAGTPTGPAAAKLPVLPAQGAGGDPCLPFTMPTADVLFAAQRRVFAHYFYPFPLSIDNLPAALDYYNTEYLLGTGEADKWLAQGGYLRQRPLPVAPHASANWLQLNMEAEIRLAIARGITGFTFDVMSLEAATGPGGQLQLMLGAAQAVDGRFKIVVMPDIAALGSDSGAVVQIIAAAASSPAAYRLADGRLVVSAFDAGANSPAWWSAVIAQLNAQGIKIAFVPTFLGWSSYAPAFAGISYGFADWGSALPAVAASMEGDPALAHSKYDRIFMMPVDPQQYRPKDSLYQEAGNSAAFRGEWTSAIAGGADWVQLVTWSDFSESSELEPYTDATLARNIGTGFYDLNGYYAAWFLTGARPSITHDVLYYFHRRQPTNAAAPGQTYPVKAVSSTSENEIELVAFLTAPGVVSIAVGGNTYQQNAPAGISSFKVPLAPGLPTFGLGRGGVWVFAFTGGVQIYGSAGNPTGVSDMTYWSGSGSQGGVCSL